MNEKREIDALLCWTTNQVDKGVYVITPNKLAVVFLLQEYVKLRPVLLKKAMDFLPKYRKNFNLLLLKLIQYPDMSYKELYDHLISSTYRLHDEHLAAFQKVVSTILEGGIEVFHNLPANIEKIMNDTATPPGGMTQLGIGGLLLRRFVITLDRMTFPELIKLYQNVCEYFQKSIRAIALGSKEAGLMIDLEEQDDAVNRLKGDREFGRWSRRQTDLFVAQQCSLLQCNETKALNPRDLQAKLAEIIMDNPLYSQAHFLNYLNCVRVRDYVGAVDNLHRAFDRNAVKNLSSVETRAYQYLSLNLAILHAQFGYMREAHVSLREAIMLAQEVGDRTCLQLANSWLSYLDHHKIQVPDRVPANSVEANIIKSISLGIQFFVKSVAQLGFEPAKQFELLMWSDYFNCQQSMQELIANCMAEKAALWTLYGRYDLASLTSQVLLSANMTQMGKTYNGENLCHALCCLALWLSLNGDHFRTFSVLQYARKCFPRDPNARLWTLTELHVAATKAIHAGEWQKANLACCRIHPLDKNLSLLQRATLNIARGNLSIANGLLQTLLKDHSLANREPLVWTRAMILHATALIPSPEVINVLIEAHEFARRKHFDYEVATIDSLFAHQLLAMGMPVKALKSCQEALDVILQHGGIYDRAKIMFLFVKCSVAAAEAPKKRQEMEKCDSFLMDAVKFFTKLGAYVKVKDIYAFMAQFYHEIGMQAERNKCAFKFREIDEQYPTGSFEVADAII
ncbi:anaphase-promoting complex subunit 5 [Phlebotomus argentipes]|uniref:anaphase-promoting complex subunit 5 n=1 Tax=Phlebotomus argentipes TaxID=94469 RepID=UPI002892A73F|nr:anaphase-promoting complex subunit 5 [Phlebotomus argentipes]